MQQKSALNEDLVARLAQEPHFAVLAAFAEANHLKQLFRQGWLRAGISREQCESVAEHTFGVALLALFLTGEEFGAVKRDRVVRMALIHDLGEVYVGDVTPADAMPAAEKHALERQAVEKIFGKLSRGGSEYLELWDEYEQGETPDARLVHELDRVEMALQALVYEEQGAAGLDPFYESARKAVHLAENVLQLDAILRNRPRIE